MVLSSMAAHQLALLLGQAACQSSAQLGQTGARSAVIFGADAEGKASVVVSPLVRLTNKKDAKIEDIGKPEDVLASIGPFITGSYLDAEDVQSMRQTQQDDGLTCALHSLRYRTKHPSICLVRGRRGAADAVCTALLRRRSRAQLGARWRGAGAHKQLAVRPAWTWCQGLARALAGVTPIVAANFDLIAIVTLVLWLAGITTMTRTRRTA